MAQSKATKKFEKKHLTDTLKRRKEFAKVKQRHQVKDKKRVKRQREEENEEPPLKKAKQDELQSMSVDNFFAEPVPVPDGVDSEDEHAETLKGLEAKDPEFFKYLKENDAELLEFEAGDLNEIDELSDGETSNADNLTKNIVNGWETSAREKHSLRAMREIVLAFRAAAHQNEEKEFKYTISEADVVNTALKHVPLVLNHHLPLKGAKFTETKQFRTLTPMLKSHLASLQHLLANLSDSATIKLTLQSILEMIPYILSFKKSVRELLSVVVEVWADAGRTEADRISAFLVIRRLASIGDLGIQENVLRITYQGFIRGSRSTTVHNLSGINLMKNSAVELWGLVDKNVSYTTAFAFVRQLAIHLRSSIKNNANESYKAVYNWQYVHSLDFWSRVVSMHCESMNEAVHGKSPLRPLVYPLTQVTLGAMRLVPTAAYFALRFHLVRALLRITAATGDFIPLSMPLFEVLQSAEMKHPPKASTLRPLDFETSIRTTKSYLRTRVYQDGVGDEVVELFAEYFFLWSKHVAFPELAVPVIVMLKRWLKEVSSSNRNAKLNSALSLLVSKLEANINYIDAARAKVNFAPNNRTEVEMFLKDTDPLKSPLGVFVQTQRKQKAERKRMLDAARSEAETRKDKETGFSDDD